MELDGFADYLQKLGIVADVGITRFHHRGC
ncbi:hypothetical protein O9992_23940 [Vibrio lentus]|nr:hypothetical protein [Vibrio lentus]